MIRVTEKKYKKKIGHYSQQIRLKTTVWLFGIIPVFVSDKHLGGDIE